MWSDSDRLLLFERFDPERAAHQIFNISIQSIAAFIDFHVY